MSTPDISVPSPVADTVARLVGRLEAAWNGTDHQAFAAEFAPDADFVNVRGDHERGRHAIARGHEAIWSSIYAGSTLEYALTHLREIVPGVLLAHLAARLRVPAGPMAGEIAAIPSLVLVDDGGTWRIAAFHNTSRRSD
jgi:uncharacterized protein (TIGR02246 family)